MITSKYESGRPKHTDKKYQTWLNDMRPFLLLGNSLYNAIDKASLLRHKDSIYKKYRSKDWFSEKIDAFQNYPGEIVNSIFVRIIMNVDEKVKKGRPITSEEMKTVRFFAEKHRSCTTFFVNRHEVVNQDSSNILEVIDELNKDQSNIADHYAEYARQAEIESNKNESLA